MSHEKALRADKALGTEKAPSTVAVHSAASDSGSDAPSAVVDIQHADVTVAFLDEHDALVPEISPDQERRLARKVFWRMLALAFVINLVMYMDKAALSYSAIMGLWEHTSLTQNEYDTVNTLFYVGFLVGSLPGPWIVQRLPLSKVLCVITVLWAVLTFLVCVATNFGGMVALRFFLGLVEAPSIPILTTTMGMFMTRAERETAMPLFYASAVFDPIPVGFIAYGCMFANVSFGSYRILQIVIGGLCLVASVLIWFVYPDNPTKVGWLSTEEKVWTIRRVHRTQLATIEQKQVKLPHVLEALRDPVSWLFVGFFFFQQLANNLPYQQNLLFTNMGGVSNLDSTLVSVAGAGYGVAWCAFAALTLYIWPNSSCFCIMWSQLPAFVGSIVAAALPLSNTIGLLAAILLASNSFGQAWICAFGLASATAGASYSKRLTRNFMVLIGYSVSNMISPQLWQQSDAPRYIPAWIVQIVLSFTVAPLLIFAAWVVLWRRNKARRAANFASERRGVVEANGELIVVDKASLDQTDLEDTTFIYPL